MKKTQIFFLLLLTSLMISGLAAATTSGWYPQAINTGTEISSDAGGSVRNGLGLVAIETIGTAESSDDDQLFAAIPANNTTNFLVKSTGAGSSTFLAQPDRPRNIIATPSGSATGAVKLTGTDIKGTAITENLTFSGAGVVASTKAFKTVTRIDGSFTQNTARTLKIGTGDLLGLNTKLAFNSVLFALVNGAKEAVAPTVTTSDTTLSLNTIDTNTAPGGHTTTVYYVVTA